MAHLIALSVFISAVTLMARRVVKLVTEIPGNDKQTTNKNNTAKA